MIYLLAYAAGLLTLINPCILPVLPIVLASAVQGHRHGPIALATGMTLAFVAFGLGIAVIGQGLGLTSDDLSRIAAWAMLAFGVVLLVPRFAHRFELATAGFAGRADSGISNLDPTSLSGQALTGTLLGAAWSPCVGPTLGGAIALAYQGENLIHAGMIMLAFAFGVSTLILFFAYGARGALQNPLRRLAQYSRPFMGVALVLVALAILSGGLNVAEGWALDNLPVWLQDLSVSL